MFRKFAGLVLFWILGKLLFEFADILDRLGLPYPLVFSKDDDLDLRGSGIEFRLSLKSVLLSIFCSKPSSLKFLMSLIFYRLWTVAKWFYSAPLEEALLSEVGLLLR